MKPSDLTDEQIRILREAIDRATRRVPANRRPDVCQDLWVLVLRELQNYDPAKSRLGTWASRFVTWRLQDIQRRSGGRPVGPVRPDGTRRWQMPKDARVRCVSLAALAAPGQAGSGKGAAPAILDTLISPVAPPHDVAIAREILERAGVRRELRLALEILFEGGTIRMAAKAIGICESGFHNRLRDECRRRVERLVKGDE